MFVHTRSGKGQQWVWKENIWNLNLEQPNMSFAVAHTGWLNLDRFAPTATKTHSVTVEVSTTAPSSSVKTFFVFSDKNSVIEGTLDANGKMKFDIPAGAKGEIVTAVYNTGIPAISREAIVVNADLEKTVTPQSGTLEAFREEVAGLDRG